MKTAKFPSPEQIKHSIEVLEEKMSIPAINMNKNFPIKEGYQYCLELMKKRLENPANEFFIAETEVEWKQLNEIYRKQLSDIKELTTTQGRSIAVLCVDWLNGNNDAIAFLAVKIATR